MQQALKPNGVLALLVSRVYIDDPSTPDGSCSPSPLHTVLSSLLVDPHE